MLLVKKKKERGSSLLNFPNVRALYKNNTLNPSRLHCFIKMLLPIKSYCSHLSIEQRLIHQQFLVI